MDEIERLVPADRLEAALAFLADAAQRRAQPALAVDELGVRGRHLRAQHAVGVRVGVRASDTDDDVVLHAHREAARVWTVEWTHARVSDHAHRRAPSRVGLAAI